MAAVTALPSVRGCSTSPQCINTAPRQTLFFGRPPVVHRCLPHRTAYRRNAAVQPVAVALPRAKQQHSLSASKQDLPQSLELQQLPAKQSVVQRFIGNLLRGAAVAALAATLVLTSASPAWAARSGGRVGGSSFSSARSYGGSSSRSYSGGSSLGSGGLGSSRGYSSTAPSLSFGGGVGLHSWFAPSPWGYGYGYPAPVAGGGGGGLFSLLVWGVVALVVVQVVQSFLSNGDGVSIGSDRVAVAKVQIGLLGSARQLQSDLYRIALRADTNTPEGLHYILQETVLALSRNPDYCVYGAAQVSNQRDLDSGEDKFNEVSIQERSKFKEETLSNVGGRSRRGALRRTARGDQDLIVVTILAAVQGGLKLPSLTNREELRTALNRLGAVRSEQVMAVEVLWTPQEEGDYFSRDELAYDYPTLNTL